MNKPFAAHEPYSRRLKDMPISEQIASIESHIRAQPANAEHRWALFQLLCVTGEWTRAVQQLPTWAKLEPQHAQTAQACRDLVRAERWRAKVVAGKERPGFVLEPPAWVVGLVDALHLAASDQTTAADDAREAALDAAPLVAASTPDGKASWIADSDSRFGPVCEVITAGHYRWVPFSDLATWHVSRPEAVVDLIWARCVLTLSDGSIVRGFMPARYPGSEAAGESLSLGRETVWQETGRSSVIALGQKTWAADRGDFGLFDLANGEFGGRAINDAAGAKAIDGRA